MWVLRAKPKRWSPFASIACERELRRRQSEEKEIGEDRLFMKVGDVLGTSNQKLEEASLTAIRTRMAEIQGRDFLVKQLKAHRATQSE